VNGSGASPLEAAPAISAPTEHPPTHSAAAPVTAAAPPAAGASADCAVPYTIDAEGIRHPKLECL
jgi:hypothetical protein